MKKSTIEKRRKRAKERIKTIGISKYEAKRLKKVELKKQKEDESNSHD